MPHTTAPDPDILLLQALAWLLGEPQRADRLLALTGLDGDALRGGLDDPAVLSAVADFLGAHEPDLIACAEALDVSAPHIIDAGRRVTGERP